MNVLCMTGHVPYQPFSSFLTPLNIGYTSAELLFGPAVNMNRFVLDEQSPSTTLEKVAWWDRQQDIHKDILEKAAKFQKGS